MASRTSCGSACSSRSEPKAATWPARRRASLLPGWSTRQVWAASLVLCAVIACDTTSGPHLILIGLLITGPCCALLTARWALTAAVSCFADALAVVLGVPDQIFATVTKYTLLTAVACGTELEAGAPASRARPRRHHSWWRRQAARQRPPPSWRRLEVTGRSPPRPRHAGRRPGRRRTGAP